MMMGQKQLITKAKYQEIEARLQELKTVKRKEIAEKLEYARGLGDLSENAEYHEARDLQAGIESEIDELEMILINAEILSGKKSDTVTVGSTVVLVKKGTRTEITYEVVGSAEADMLKNKISSESPLGSALLGKSKGDAVELKTPNGSVAYTVKKLG